MASSRRIVPALTSRARSAFRVCMPSAALDCMTVASWKHLLSRIRLPTASVPTRISVAATRPPPIASGIRACVITPFRIVDSCVRIWFWAWGGQLSMIRSSVCAAPVVCRVDMTKCPVSAAVTAAEIVS